MSEKLASAEIDESRKRFEKQAHFYPLDDPDDYGFERFPSGRYKLLELQMLWEVRQAAEQDSRERIAQLAREVAKEVGGQFAETHMLNTALNKFIARLERIRGVNR